MMFLGESNLVAAVSNGGGLGILTGLTPGSPEKLREAIRKVRTLTDKPFAVNLTFLPAMVPPPYAEYAQVVIDEGVKIAETAGGPAAIPIIKMYKAAGIFVIHKCTSIRHAQAAEKSGVGEFVFLIPSFHMPHASSPASPGVSILFRPRAQLTDLSIRHAFD